jgi:Domain of unknown function (DUF6916)
MIEQFRITTFEPLVGQAFEATLPTGESFRFELETVEPLGEKTRQFEDPDRKIPFSLLLLGPAGISIPQGTYRFSIPGIGAFDMFVVPVERRGDRLGYQAIFN